MRLGTIRYSSGTRAVRLEDDGAVVLPFDDVGALLRSGNGWRTHASAAGERVALDAVRHRPVVVEPEKVVCVGANFDRGTGEPRSRFPSLFTKFPRTLIGAGEDIELPAPAVSEQVDWEVELAAVIGTEVRREPERTAARAIAGFTVLNDISVRDWQWRTSQIFPGKNFERTTPLGPHMVSVDEVADVGDLELSCEVDGQRVQHGRAADMIFSPAEVIAYVSTFTTLVPGDVVSLGTPPGSGVTRVPPVFLAPGQVVRSVISGIGEMSNRCVGAR